MKKISLFFLLLSIISSNNMCMKKRNKRPKEKPLKLSKVFKLCKKDDSLTKRLIIENQNNKKELKEVKKRIVELKNDKQIIKCLSCCCFVCGFPILRWCIMPMVPDIVDAVVGGK